MLKVISNFKKCPIRFFSLSGELVVVKSELLQTSNRANV